MILVKEFHIKLLNIRKLFFLILRKSVDSTIFKIKLVSCKELQIKFEVFDEKFFKEKEGKKVFDIATGMEGIREHIIVDAH